MGDFKTKIKYKIRSNDFTCSLLNIYFAIKKQGIGSLKIMMKEELENYHHRIPWYVNKKELKRQQKSSSELNITFLVDILCENKGIDDIIQSIDSILAQTLQNYRIYCVGVAKEYIKSLSEKYRNLINDKLEFCEHNVIDIDEQGSDLVYTADICAGDILHPYAFFLFAKKIKSCGGDILYCDCSEFDNTVKDAKLHHYKQDFSKVAFYGYNYIGEFFFSTTNLYKKLHGYNISDYQQGRYYDYILRAIESGAKITHVTECIFYKKKKNKIISDKCFDEKAALEAFFMRQGISGEIEQIKDTGIRRIKFTVDATPHISIIIPNKDHVEDIARCIKSIKDKTTYKNYDIIIVENNSTDSKTFDFYKEIGNDSRISVCVWNGEFNYSAINNYAVERSNGEYILLLNNDTEVISSGWLEEMLSYARQDDVGAVGTMLYYPDETIQHAGVIMGIGGVAGHSHKNISRGNKGYYNRLMYAQEMSAVTAACLMISREKYDEVGGLDEGYQVAFNDIDFCMKLNAKGYKCIFTPFAELYHYESKSRGYENTEEKEIRFRKEIQRFQKRWSKKLVKCDPYYNPHLTVRYEDFSLK